MSNMVLVETNRLEALKEQMKDYVTTKVISKERAISLLSNLADEDRTHPQVKANAEVTLAAITGQLNKFLLNPQVNVTIIA